MKIDFKKPKYILPLICFPFIMVLYYVITSWKSSPQKSVEAMRADSINRLKVDQINPDMPGVSTQVAKTDLKDKFQSYQDAYKNKKDLSALGTISQEKGEPDKNGEYHSSYDQSDVERMKAAAQLDSLRRVLNTSKATVDNRMKNLVNSRTGRHSTSTPPKTPQQIFEEMQAQRRQMENTDYSNDRPANQDPMRLFREQMRIMDSISKANKNEARRSNGKPGEPEETRFLPSKDTSVKPLPVSRVKSEPNAFNTLRRSSPEESIKAMIDQDEKVYSDSRVRLRLLDDIFVGDTRVPKGTYIYAFVSGFQAQRVNLSITQIVVDNIPLPVRLDAFDNDGYYGLNVPGSNFREFSKDIGTQGTSGLSSIQMSSDQQSVTSGLVSKLFQTSGNAVNRMIRKDKAYLKYNYVIYLKEKKEK